MAMLDYGAVVKKNGKLLEHKDMFNNYSTLKEGYFIDKYTLMTWSDDTDELHNTLVSREYPEDESVRDFYGQKHSVIGNYMSVVGDKDFLVATYKYRLIVCDSEKCLVDYIIGDNDYEKGDWQIKRPIHLETPFGTITIRRINKCTTAVASFWYKDNYYEILFGYGVDDKKFIMSNYAKRWFYYKDLRKIRRWYNS